MRQAALLLLGGLLALTACRQTRAPAQEPAKPGGAVLLISSDVRGYLGPCGCSENMRGGIGRAAFQVAEARKGNAPVFFLDGGDSLFGHEKLPPAEVPQEELKARTLAKAFVQMGLVTRGAGELDATRGPEFLASLRLPIQQNGSFKLLDARGHKLGVVVAATAEELRQASAQAKEAGAGWVLAFLHQGLEQAQKAAEAPGLKADFIVAVHHPGEFAAEENRLVRAAVPVARVQSKGRSLLRVDLDFGGQGPFELLRSQSEAERELNALEQRLALMDKQINTPGLRDDAKAMYQAKLQELLKRRDALVNAPPPSTAGKNAFSVRFVPLEATLPSLPEAQEWVKAYDQEVARINLAWAKEHGQDCPAPKKGEAAFVGNASCEECHAEAFEVWGKSKHAHAYETLASQGKQYHLDCVGCHVTGFEKPGGVCRVDKVEGRKDVGCESCHGPGSLHAAEPSDANIVAKPDQALCVTCHNPENSPHFDFPTYLPQILGKGHGQPAAARGK
jgi:hypothetical protein